MKKFPAYILGLAFAVSVLAALSSKINLRGFIMILMLLATLGLVAYSVMKLAQSTH